MTNRWFGANHGANKRPADVNRRALGGGGAWIRRPTRSRLLQRLDASARAQRISAIASRVQAATNQRLRAAGGAAVGLGGGGSCGSSPSVARSDSKAKKLAPSPPSLGREAGFFLNPLLATIVARREAAAEMVEAAMSQRAARRNERSDTFSMSAACSWLTSRQLAEG